MSTSPDAKRNFGTLFVVSTPIGNLEDITLRALRILSQVPLIAAEDTRSAQRLLHAHGMWPLAQGRTLLSYFQGNEAMRTPSLLEFLQKGQDVALISEAGLPGISDPGPRLIQAAIGATIPIQVIPGPCAATTALVASGLSTERFLFLGFPPRQTQARHSLFASVAHDPATLIFYESPLRLHQTLCDLSESLGTQRMACIGRELTKHYEEFIRGSLANLANRYQETPPKGEITLIIAGAAKDDQVQPVEIEKEISTRLAAGESPKEIALVLALRHGKPKRQIYQLTLALNKQ